MPLYAGKNGRKFPRNDPVGGKSKRYGRCDSRGEKIKKPGFLFTQKNDAEIEKRKTQQHHEYKIDL
jgi:hypothetical protein